MAFARQKVQHARYHRLINSWIFSNNLAINIINNTTHYYGINYLIRSTFFYQRLNSPLKYEIYFLKDVEKNILAPWIELRLHKSLCKKILTLYGSFHKIISPTIFELLLKTNYRIFCLVISKKIEAINKPLEILIRFL